MAAVHLLRQVRKALTFCSEYAIKSLSWEKIKSRSLDQTHILFRGIPEAFYRICTLDGGKGSALWWKMLLEHFTGLNAFHMAKMSWTL